MNGLGLHYPQTGIHIFSTHVTCTQQNELGSFVMLQCIMLQIVFSLAQTFERNLIPSRPFC